MTTAVSTLAKGTVANWRLAAYASPAMITYLAWMPLGYVIIKFYATYTSLGLATIGLVILLGRLFDAFTDPLIAYLSDAIDTRWGRRKPWIVLSAPVFATGFAMLVMPPAEIHWSYLLLANLVLYSGWTFFEVTHVAWGLEFERDYKRRTHIGILLKLFSYLGSLAFFAYPFVFNPEPGSSEFTRPVMNALGITVAAAFPLFALFSVLAVPREQRLGKRAFNFRTAIRQIASNRNFLAYLAAYGLWVLSDGVLIGLFIIYIDVYHDLSLREGILLLATYLSRVAAVPLAMFVFRRLSRKRIWCIATLGNALLFPTILLMPQGAPAYPYLLLFAVCVGALDCIIGIVAITLLGDVIDEDALVTGMDKAASYKAAVNLAEKTLRAAGISGGLVFVSLAGLEIGARNSAFALAFLVAILGCATALLNLASSLAMRSIDLKTPDNPACLAATASDTP